MRKLDVLQSLQIRTALFLEVQLFVSVTRMPPCVKCRTPRVTGVTPGKQVMTPCVTATTFHLHLIRILHVQLRFLKDDETVRVTEDAPGLMRARISATRDLLE